MRIATVVGLFCVAGALTGCSTFNSMFSSAKPGSTVEFVSSNADTVLLDFGARPAGEVTYAGQVAAQQCKLFGRGGAALESLTVRTEGTIRATYLCSK